MERLPFYTIATRKAKFSFPIVTGYLSYIKCLNINILSTVPTNCYCKFILQSLEVFNRSSANFGLPRIPQTLKPSGMFKISRIGLRLYVLQLYIIGNKEKLIYRSVLMSFLGIFSGIRVCFSAEAFRIFVGWEVFYFTSPRNSSHMYCL